jgi:hypothetical protein
MDQPYLTTYVDRADLRNYLLSALTTTDHLAAVAAPTPGNAGLIAGRLQVIRELAQCLGLEVPGLLPYLTQARELKLACPEASR